MFTSSRLTAAAICGAALLATSATPAMAQQDPGGNNGTVKIDGVEFDDHPNNEPHPGCLFQIDLYNYDLGNLAASIQFEAEPPTQGGVLLTDSVAIGEDPAGGGDDDLDASKTYDLSQALAGIEPHPNQGHHVKLTINAQGSKGADVKHKTFWVEGCASEPPPVGTPPGATPPVAPPPGASPPGAAPPGSPVAPGSPAAPQRSGPSRISERGQHQPRTRGPGRARSAHRRRLKSGSARAQLDMMS